MRNIYIIIDNKNEKNIKNIIFSVVQKVKKSLKKFYQFLHLKINYIELPQILQLIYLLQQNYIRQLIIVMFSILKSDDLITILARVKHRLQSKQKSKYKRIRKTLDLIEFLMKNGAIEFVAVMIENLIHFTNQLKNMKTQDSLVYQKVRAISKRILNLCDSKKFLKEERIKAKKMRKKIVGAGNTMDSYGDKFLSTTTTSSSTDQKKDDNSEKEKDFEDKKNFEDRVDDIITGVKKKEIRQQSLQRIENQACKYDKTKKKNSFTEQKEVAQDDAIFI